MLRLLLRLIIYAALIVFIAWIVPGISVANFLSAIIVCIIIALINTFIKPILQVITLPVNILTLGLFSFILNALLFMLAGYIAPGFHVENFLSAIIGSILLAIFAPFVSKISV